MLEGGGSVHRDVFFVPERNVVGGRLGAGPRANCNKQHSCGDKVGDAHMSSNYEFEVGHGVYPVGH
jgi:hypothetical protein